LIFLYNGKIGGEKVTEI